MKSIRLTFPQRLASVVAACVLSACGGGGSGGSPTPANPAPIINMSMSTSTAFTGQTTTLTWSASNASSCTGSGNWSGTQATSGSLTVNATQVGELSYSLNCSGAGGSATQTSKLAVTQSPLTLIAGNIGGPGNVDGIGSNARFQSPQGIARDKDGNLYVADSGSHTIRKITPAGVVSTYAGQVGVAGFANGAATSAKFRYPLGLSIDANGNLYVADSENHLIRKISVDGIVTTIAGVYEQPGQDDGPADKARFRTPTDLVIDRNNNLYITDSENNTIRKMTANGQVSTLAGSPRQSGLMDGSGANARFKYPTGIAIDDKDHVYIADTSNNAIRRIDPAGNVSTIKPSAGEIKYPGYLKVLSNGDILISERNNHAIKKISLDNRVTIFAGQEANSGSENGASNIAKFNSPKAMAIDSTGNLFVAENPTIRKIAANGEVSTVAGSGRLTGATEAKGSTAKFYTPTSVVTDRQGNLFITDMNNHTIRKVTPNGETSLFAGSVGNSGNIDGMQGLARFDMPYTIAIDINDNLYVADGNDFIRKITPQGLVSHIRTYANNNSSQEIWLNFASGISVDGLGNIFVAISGKIFKIAPSGSTTLIAGSGYYGNDNGVGEQARFAYLGGIVADLAGNLYVADNDNHNIRKISPSGQVTTFAGSVQGLPGAVDGTGLAARFNFPHSLTIDKTGNIFVGDLSNYTIRKITPEGVVSTVAGTATMGNLVLYSIKTLSSPYGITIDNAGKFYAVMDQGVFQLHF
nr:hypothetical protein [uncultured Undibacterium sp.]